MSAVIQLRREPLTAAEQQAFWERLAGDPALMDLPYKMETDAWGGVYMSPAQSRHSRMVRLVSRLLEGALGGEALTELPVITEIGTKVPDVAWCSESFLDANGSDIALLKAPEICVEVVSPSNSESEMHEKVAAYLAKGAMEVWLVSEAGAVDIYDHTGVRSTSHFAVDPKELT